MSYHGASEEEDDENNSERSQQSERKGPKIKTVEKSVRIMDEGQSFGEIGLLCDVKRQANVKATTVSHLCVLRREDFERLSLQHEDLRKKAHHELGRWADRFEKKGDEQSKEQLKAFYGKMRQFDDMKKDKGESTLKRLYRESTILKPGGPDGRDASPAKERASSPERAASPAASPARRSPSPSPSTGSERGGDGAVGRGISPGSPSGPGRGPGPGLTKPQLSAILQIKGMLGDLQRRQAADTQFREQVRYRIPRPRSCPRPRPRPRSCPRPRPRPRPHSYPRPLSPPHCRPGSSWTSSN